RSGENRNLSARASRFFERDLHHAKMLLPRERGALPGSAAGNEKIDPAFNLPPYQGAQGFLVQRPARLERRYQCCTATLKHVHLPKRTSENSWQPWRPIIHCAAFNAPRAKPSRFRAECRSVMVSA